MQGASSSIKNKLIITTVVLIILMSVQVYLDKQVDTWWIRIFIGIIQILIWILFYFLFYRRLKEQDDPSIIISFIALHLPILGLYVLYNTIIEKKTENEILSEYEHTETREDTNDSSQSLTSKDSHIILFLLPIIILIAVLIIIVIY